MPLSFFSTVCGRAGHSFGNGGFLTPRIFGGGKRKCALQIIRFCYWFIRPRESVRYVKCHPTTNFTYPIKTKKADEPVTCGLNYYVDFSFATRYGNWHATEKEAKVDKKIIEDSAENEVWIR